MYRDPYLCISRFSRRVTVTSSTWVLIFTTLSALFRITLPVFRIYSQVCREETYWEWCRWTRIDPLVHVVFSHRASPFIQKKLDRLLTFEGFFELTRSPSRSQIVSLRCFRNSDLRCSRTQS